MTALTRVLAITCLAASTFTGAALAQEGGLTPLPLDANDIDYSGVWRYATSNHGHSGPCPAGRPFAGEMTIAAGDEGAVALRITAGATCRPASMCSFAGGVEGGNLVVYNSDTVDDEGGEASNAMVLYFYSEKKAAGRVRSTYVHPQGMECSWQHRVDLSRGE